MSSEMKRQAEVYESTLLRQTRLAAVLQEEARQEKQARMRLEQCLSPKTKSTVYKRITANSTLPVCEDLYQAKAAISVWGASVGANSRQDVASASPDLVPAMYDVVQHQNPIPVSYTHLTLPYIRS
eukprot:TRINITY_DN51053_c0_g1_i1.p1 TRINITY_DN51053_c0_g1~~TRINITY_DN51053_c0_g1_i1.p1  ORF type:complete len:126 (-),score=21.05 TRINITY_DN51053_c0_g1_i1:43-420(-)